MGLLKSGGLNAMRAVWLFMGIFWSYTSLAQDIPVDSIPSDSVQEIPEAEEQSRWQLPFGIFGEAYMENVPSPGGRELANRIGVGVEYQRFILGIYQSMYLGEFSQTLIFPNDFDLNYMHGGFFLGRRLYTRNYLDADLRLSYGRGDMLWKRSDSGAGFIRDKITSLRMEAMISFIPIRFIKLFGVLGYNRYRGVSLKSVNEDDFSGLTIGLGIKVGYFNKAVGE